jgi:outer membrane lipoprotein-sorting protein
MQPVRCSLVVVAVASLLAIPVRADEKLDALLQRTRDAIAKLQTLQADVEMVEAGARLTGTVQLKRPNLARLELKSEAHGFVLTSDGKAVYQHDPGSKEYYKGEPGVDGRDIMPLIPSSDILIVFFQPGRLGMAGASPATSWVYGGRQKVGPDEYEVVDWTKSLPAFKVTWRFFISPKDNLVHRVDTINKGPNGDSLVTLTLKNLRVNAPVADTTFRWTPPRDAKELPQPRFQP